MICSITKQVTERGTIVFHVSWKDASGELRSPSRAFWSLTDKWGNVINDRSNIPVTSLKPQIDVVLSGDDLKISDNDLPLAENGRCKYAERFFTILYYYDSDLGAELSGTTQVPFGVIDLVAI